MLAGGMAFWLTCLLTGQLVQLRAGYQLSLLVASFVPIKKGLIEQESKNILVIFLKIPCERFGLKAYFCVELNSPRSLIKIIFEKQTKNGVCNNVVDPVP